MKRNSNHVPAPIESRWLVKTGAGHGESASEQWEEIRVSPTGLARYSY